MGAFFTIMIGVFAIKYSKDGNKYYSDINHELHNNGKYGDLKIEEFYDTNKINSREIIPDEESFILYKISKNEDFIDYIPIYNNISGHYGYNTVLVPFTQKRVKNVPLINFWSGRVDINKATSTYSLFGDEKYEKRLYLNNENSIQRACNDIGILLTSYELKPTIIFDYVATDRIFVCSEINKYYIGTNRDKIINAASNMITRRKYPGFKGAHTFGCIAIFLGILSIPESISYYTK